MSAANLAVEYQPPGPEEYARRLADDPDYRVLRRFRPRDRYSDEQLTDPKVGLYVDVETTGLNTDDDRIIQFAGVRFTFDSTGRIGQVGPTYAELEDPEFEITPEISELTGITPAMVKGKKIDDGLVDALMQDVVLVVAHNADFDRKMLERRFSGFDSVHWACSQRDVKWERFGARGVKLEYLLMECCGEFYDAHEALADCLAGVHVLAHPRASIEQIDIERGLEVSPFQMLLDSVREPTLRLCAWSSPIWTKDRLRLRRFRWNPTSRVWQKDVKASELEAERQWLLEHVYDGNSNLASYASAEKVSRKDLYSVRAV